MNISLNWLNEYVQIKDIEIKEITERLTMTGTKVEKYVEFGKPVSLVYTAQVESVDRHPLDNDLKVVILKMGEKKYQVVAKIPDVEVGDIIPFALEGATIPGKEVKKTEIKSMNSEGMICHISDFGLKKEEFPLVKSSGLIVFPDDVETGLDVSNLLGLGDYIIEFEITPNRPDCLSVEGIAREVAVTFDRPLKKELWQDKVPTFEKVDTVNNIGVSVLTNDCKRYVLNVANEVTIKPSPYEIQLKLIKSGFSVINNIVDITNFIALEMGQPLHAFDQKNLSGNIQIRKANQGESLTLLDDTEKELSESIMVIADNKKAVAVAGIMGGRASGISENTNNVVFEAASFVRGSIRNSSKKLGVRTEASTKYEKGLSTRLPLYAMNRVCNLIEQTQSGKITGQVVDIDNSSYLESKVMIDYEKINRIIGLHLPIEEIDGILTKLGFTISYGIVSVPYYRQDVSITEDLAEEVARIYGYDKLTSTMPCSESTRGSKTKMQQFEESLKQISLATGFHEIYTYTFFSQDTLTRAFTEFEYPTLFKTIKLSNPLSKDFEYMRTTTVPHMLEALERNYLKKNMQAKLFEIGKVFLKPEHIEKGELPEEKQYLTYGMYGKKWDFYTMKNTIHPILSKLKVQWDIERSKSLMFHPGISADVYIKGECVLSFGKVSPKIIKNYDLPEDTYLALLDVEKLFHYQVEEILYKELPKYPAVERDLAFVVTDDILSSDIIKALKGVSQLIESIELFDVYQGEQIEQGKKSMAYQIRLRNQEKTLEEIEIVDVMEKIMTILHTKFNASIRK